MMYSIRRWTLLLFLCGILGCQPSIGAKKPASAPAARSEPVSAPTVSRDPKDAFMQAFRQASVNKDLEAMLQLYCFDGVDAEMRDVVRGNAKDELRQPVTDLQIVEAEPGKHGPTVEGGIRWRPSLPVVAVMKAQFAKAPPGSGFWVSEAEHTLGIKSGQYRITVPVRE
jgi:hypothetical protein